MYGPFRLATPDGVEIVISSRRARALLAMLCLAPGEALDRHHVSTLLWPGRFQAQARASLRQCLLGVDKVLASLPMKVLDTSHGRIAIDPSAIRTDLANLEAALAAGRVSEACDLLADIGDRPLLDQLDVGPAFAQWLAGRRRQVESRLQTAIDRSLARMDDEGGSGPERIRLSDAWRACGRTPEVAGDGRCRIVILPFALFAAMEEPFFLPEGVVEELTWRLGSIPALALVGRASVGSVAARDRTLPEMAQALTVSH